MDENPAESPQRGGSDSDRCEARSLARSLALSVFRFSHQTPPCRFFRLPFFLDPPPFLAALARRAPPLTIPTSRKHI